MIAIPRDRKRRVASLVRNRIERGGERLWRFDDFNDLPFPAVAKALSRLARSDQIERLSKGTYYRWRQTRFGRSRPNPTQIRQIATRRKSIFPSGVAAANLLGFTTQSPRHGELATTGPSLPRKLVGSEVIIHTRRPATWSSLGQTDAALLDFLRCGGRSGELSPGATIQKAMELLSEPGRFERLLMVADTEPPRVRAMLGALGEQMDRDDRRIGRLRASLNPLSRFDFGLLAALPNAGSWHAKER